MALQGTLKDFGIAEILQLIGQQAKSGVLHLRGRDEEIHISMAEGSVVRAEHAGRRAKDRLGGLLVRAEIITQEELDYALDVQRRSLRRLGDILAELGFCTKEQLREMTSLQTTETIYRLFHWKSGTYEFVPGDVEWDAETVTPLRAESVLMEGFRQVDEWPMVRRRISSTAMTFERLKTLGPAAEAPEPTAGADVDAAFDALGKPEESSGEFANLGPNERRAYDLAVPGRTVEKIVDLSRLGEFETCKALLGLVNLGYLKPIPPARRAAQVVGEYARDWQGRLRSAVGRVGATLVIAAALAGLAVWVDERGLAFDESARTRLRDNGAQRFLARNQMARLRSALEIYRLETGEYPEHLSDLVGADLVSARDLRYPWSEDYYYRRRPHGRFVLLPPVE